MKSQDLAVHFVQAAITNPNHSFLENALDIVWTGQAIHAILND